MDAIEVRILDGPDFNDALIKAKPKTNSQRSKYKENVANNEQNSPRTASNKTAEVKSPGKKFNSRSVMS